MELDIYPRTFRKKPVEVQARRVPDLYLDDDDRDIVKYAAECIDLANWCDGTSYMMDSVEHIPHGIYIPTLEGEMRADPGDWIIKGVKGEFYPCKPDIFEATYDEVIDEQPKDN